MFDKIKHILKRWINEQDALAGVEAALIFPMMLVLFVGVFDAGNAILANQKAVRASQVVADLIARQNIVSSSDLTEAIRAGELAFEPLNTDSYGVDIVSIRFDEDADSEIVWRTTQNMTPVPDPLGAVTALEEANEGVIMVSVVYEFNPMFSALAIGDIEMREVAFSRGRSASVVTQAP